VTWASIRDTPNEIASRRYESRAEGSPLTALK
jgi:hypothetical protein